MGQQQGLEITQQAYWPVVITLQPYQLVFSLVYYGLAREASAGPLWSEAH